MHDVQPLEEWQRCVALPRRAETAAAIQRQEAGPALRRRHVLRVRREDVRPVEHAQVRLLHVPQQASLFDSDHKRLTKHIELVHFRKKRILYETGQAIRHAFFFGNGMASIFCGWPKWVNRTDRHRRSRWVCRTTSSS